MTKREAIVYLTPIFKSARLQNYKDALGEALSALCAQAEREKRDQNGCEWCNSLHKPTSGSKPGGMIAIPGVRYIRDGDGGTGTMKEMYCPICGRRIRGAETKVEDNRKTEQVHNV